MRITDQLFAYIRAHADASGYLNHTEPFYPALVSIDLEQEARLDELESRLAQVESEADSIDEGSDEGDGLYNRLP